MPFSIFMRVESSTKSTHSVELSAVTFS